MLRRLVYKTLTVTHYLPLTFQLQNRVTSIGYPKVIVYIIRFLVVLRTNKQTDRHTNKQTTLNVLPKQTDIVGVDNNTKMQGRI